MHRGRRAGRHPGQPRLQRRDARKASATTRRTINRARRWRAPRGLSAPARRSGTNLTIATSAHATRVLIENGRAVGVEYRTPDGLQDGARQRRGHRLGRRLRLAAAAACCRASARREHLQQARHRGGASDMPGVGSQPARPFQHLRRLQLRPARHHERPGEQPAAAASWPACSTPSAAPGRSPAWDSMSARWCAATRGWSGRTCRSTCSPGRSRSGTATASCRSPSPAFGLSPVHLRPDGRGTVRLKSADPLARAGDPLQLPEERQRLAGA